MTRGQFNKEHSDGCADTRGGRFQSADYERTLVDRCLHQDRDAFERLVVVYALAIRAGARKAIARARSAVNCSVEDLTQEFITDLLGRPAAFLGRFERGRGPLAPWLTLVSFRHSSKVLRSGRWRLPPGEQIPLREDVLSPCLEPEVAELDGTRLLDQALDELSDNSRYVVRAHYGLPPFSEPQPAQAIAERMGWSRRTFYRRLGKALQGLRVLLRRMGFPEDKQAGAVPASTTPSAGRARNPMYVRLQPDSCMQGQAEA